MQKPSQVQQKFSEFFEQWIQRLEGTLQQLFSVPRDSSHEQEQRSLISQVMNQFKEYYTLKWALAHEDVLGFFSQSWLTPLESAHIWITGWKPSMVFKLINSLKQIQLPGATSPSLATLTDAQLKKIEQLKIRTSLEEEKMESEMERQQVSLADRPMVELAKLTNRVEDVGVSEEVKGLVDDTVKTMLASLERIMKSADCIRLKALRDVLDVLTPEQSVDFMAGTLMVKIQLRNWGKRRDLRNRKIIEMGVNI